jgi:hypothetical protein
VLLTLLARSDALRRWRVYTLSTTPVSVSTARLPAPPPPPPPACPVITPAAWHVTASLLADVTGDGRAECVLLVWRPWQDWPIQRWSVAPSPLTSYRDAAGDSNHLILLDAEDGREMWAGSALPAPLLALAVGDVDGDGHPEVVTLEGRYATGRAGPARHVETWQWNGFGFTLEWRSPASTLSRLRLADVNSDGVLDVAVR